METWPPALTCPSLLGSSAELGQLGQEGYRAHSSEDTVWGLAPGRTNTLKDLWCPGLRKDEALAQRREGWPCLVPVTRIPYLCTNS